MRTARYEPQEAPSIVIEPHKDGSFGHRLNLRSSGGRVSRTSIVDHGHQGYHIYDEGWFGMIGCRYILYCGVQVHRLRSLWLQLSTLVLHNPTTFAPEIVGAAGFRVSRVQNLALLLHQETNTDISGIVPLVCVRPRTDAPCTSLMMTAVLCHRPHAERATTIVLSLSALAAGIPV